MAARAAKGVGGGTCSVLIGSSTCACFLCVPTQPGARRPLVVADALCPCPACGRSAAHLDYEEAHLVHIGRKYFNAKWAKKVCQKTFDMTPAPRWRIILPFVINFQEYHIRRNIYLEVSMLFPLRHPTGRVTDRRAPVSWPCRRSKLPSLNECTSSASTFTKVSMI